MADEILPGSLGGVWGAGKDFSPHADHRTYPRRGTYTLKCSQPGCGWVSQPWWLNCGECAQWAPADYTAHIMATHLDETVAAIARLP